MDSPTPHLCPCGAPAPDALPPRGLAPVACSACGTPLVAPGDGIEFADERALGWALLAGIVLAGGRLAAARTTADGAVWAMPLAAAAVAAVAVRGARARTDGVRWAVLAGITAHVVCGEVFLYRWSLLGRLVAMHEAEGASNAERLATEELHAMDVWKFLHIEADLAWYAAVAAALWIGWRIAAPPVAAVALRRPAAAPGNSVEPAAPSAEPAVPEGAV